MNVNKYNLYQGFTLIEVLIALAIISASFTAIFQMFHQSEMNNRKVSQIYSRTMIEKSIFAELGDLNPLASESGSVEMGNVSYQWHTHPLSPLVQVRSEDNSNYYHIQLYRVDIKYRYNHQLHSFSFEKLGWESKAN